MSGHDAFIIDFSSIAVSESTQRLLRDEKEEFEAVLGRCVTFRPASVGEDAWTVDTADRTQTSPELRWTSPGQLISVAQNEGELLGTVNALHTLVRNEAASIIVKPSEDVSEAIASIHEEIANTYPSFALRGLDWDEICSRHLSVETPALPDFAYFAAAWIAELGDAHTSIKTAETGFNPKYRGRLYPDGVHLDEVPERSAAWYAGVRAGWIITIDDVKHWMRTVGASPQQRRQVMARRALAFKGDTRTFVASSPRDGNTAQWTERASPTTLDSIVKVVRESRDHLRLKIEAFNAQFDIHQALDELVATADATHHLTIDLRGNTGGSILLATELRDRFLRDRTQIGYVAFTDGRGSLAPRRERWAIPSERPTWPGSVDVQVDAMTFSASEDFLLGLQGLDHVTVRGSSTGGGSGRPRRIALLPGIDLAVSTAITYDRWGNPVEFRGIHPDF